MNISLIGYMGCGKSTIGKEISDITGLKFIDLDSYISSKEQMSINEIFSKKGEVYFRKIEKKYLHEILNLESIVLSLGGGTPIYYDNIETINNKSCSFYLKLSPKELAHRLMKEKEHRPLISRIEDQNLEEFIAKHIFERFPYYERAKYKINGNQDVPTIVNEIIDITKPS